MGKEPLGWAGKGTFFSSVRENSRSVRFEVSSSYLGMEETGTETERERGRSVGCGELGVWLLLLGLGSGPLLSHLVLCANLTKVALA